MYILGDQMSAGSKWGAVALAALVGVNGHALAQDTERPAIAQAQTRLYNIPTQPLASALAAFGQQSGMQVSISASLARGLSSPGAIGSMTSTQALNSLLSGTGITYRLVGNTAMLERPDTGPGTFQLDPVQVQGVHVPQQAMIGNVAPPYAGGQVATGGQLGLLGNKDVMDTPFNQTSFTAKKAQDQQATTVRDVLIDDPSVQAVIPDGAVGADFVSIRGFSVSNSNFSYGGLYGMLPYFSMVSEIGERIELLKGPSAMLNGMPPLGAIGGTVNVVPKRAPNQPLTQFTASHVSGAQFAGHADIARRFGPDKQFGVRFNGVFRAGQTDVRYNSDQRALALLGLDFLGERLRLSADLGYQYQYIGGQTPYLGVAVGVPLPWAPNVRNNPGAQPWGYNDRKDLFGVVRAEIDLTERITAHAAFGAHDFRYGALTGGSGINALNLAGDATMRPYLQSIYNSFLTADAGVRAVVDTGPIGHEFALGAALLQQETGSALVNGTAYLTNIYNTNIIARPNLPTPAANKTSTVDLSSLAFADTLSVAEKRIQLTVGGRLQRVESTNFNAATGMQTSTYVQSAFSPSLALVVKPWRNVTVYGNWIQGLQPGTIVGPTFTNAGEIFPPYKSTQYEVGVKVDWGKLTTTASLFQITQPSTITDVAANALTLNGEQRNRGLELNFFGEVADGIRLLGGAMFLDAVLTKTQGDLTNGWWAPFSPTVQLRVAGEWDTPFLPGLTVTGRAIYTGSQYIDTTYPRRSLPEWARFDLGVRYAFENPGAKGKSVVARFNVENVLDTNYWASGSTVSTLSLGAPRTFRLSLTADF